MARLIASVSPDVPRMMLEYASRAGIDVKDLGLSGGAGAGRMAMRELDALWGTIFSRAHDPVLGLHFGEAAATGMGGHILYAVMLNCPTLGDALDRFRRYHGLLADGAAPRIRDEGRCRVYSIDPNAGLGSHYSEAILAMLAVTVGRLSGNRVRPVEVRFAHGPPPDISEHRRVFGAALRFGRPQSGLALERAALEVPVIMADPDLLAWLERFAQGALARDSDAGPLAGRVFDAVEKILVKGERPRLDAVARALAMSSRRLQSRLQDEGTTFQQALDEVRSRMARDILARGEIALCDAAFLLGFSEQSAFNRAFKRWTGMTPMKYSRQRR